VSNLLLVAPMAGWVAPLDEVPDPVFSERILGDGLAIDPTAATVHAPCDGVIASCAKHALTIRAENGAEILIHVGLETVALHGQGFLAHMGEGRKVKTGEALITFDLDFVASRAKSLISPIVLTNGDAFTITRRSADRETGAGEFLMEIAAAGPGATVGMRGSETAQREAVVMLAHGIHARPAAVLANAAKRFSSEISLLLRERQVNARSVAALMSLGVRHGDRVRVEARGADAQQATADLARLIESGLGETAARTVAPPGPVELPRQKKSDERGVIRGICASPGIALGNLVHFRPAAIDVAEHGAGIAAETAALDEAIAQVRARLEMAAAHGDRSHRDILGAHVALLDDPEILDAARAEIRSGKSAGYAFRSALRTFVAALAESGDALMRERAQDLRDLERQVLMQLGGEAEAPQQLPDNAIVAAEDLLPSQLLSLEAGKIAGLCLAGGGPTSHVAILAAGMNLPTIVGAGPDVLDVPEGATVVLDADAGSLQIAPDEATVAKARAQIASRRQRIEWALASSRDECRTADGVRIEVFANLGPGAGEAEAAVAAGAEGCGLLRTEFLFVDRATPPDEDEQAAAYQAISTALQGRPLVIRTFDIGGDKPVAYLPLPAEGNPALGLRGIRAALWRPHLLLAQLAAILRVEGDCRILLPMIASLSEIRAVRAMLTELAERRNLRSSIPLGVMIETPASALIAGDMAEEADFLSIGSNDLTQYTLAMDRTHPQLAAQIDALHPAVLRLIAKTAEAAQSKRKQAALCGGLAADPLAAPILIGFGIEELSVPPAAIPVLKSTIREFSMAQCRALAEEVLRQNSAEGVRAIVQRGRTQ
jgi:multiphosphoryl transfer protein